MNIKKLILASLAGGAVTFCVRWILACMAHGGFLPDAGGGFKPA